MPWRGACRTPSHLGLQQSHISCLASLASVSSSQSGGRTVFIKRALRRR
ncbi:hypothetical protein RHECNPAF_3340018 [Rhizobium etli CNPAF512]|nr:hypothetical protein RHECNPAF_3340018 [Rhizobium etli CNPAF512]